MKARWRRVLQHHGHSLLIDEPEHLGGTNLAKPQTEAFISALAGCVDSADELALHCRIAHAGQTSTYRSKELTSNMISTGWECVVPDVVPIYGR